MRKVKLEVLKPWINTRFTELNGFEDEIVASMVVGLLEDRENTVCAESGCLIMLISFCAIVSRSPENPDSSSRFPEQKCACFHVGAMEATS